MSSESEILLGWDCPTKIVHARAGLPETKDDESFTRWMRSESVKVAALARLLFDNLAAADAPVLPALLSGSTVGHAELCARGVMCRVDYLEMTAGEIRCYTVTPKVFRPARHEQRLEFETAFGRYRTEWLEWLRRLVVRAMVIQACFPQTRVRPFLIAPVDGECGTVERLHERIEHAICYGADTALRAEAERLLCIVDVRRECLGLLPAVRTRIEEIRAFLDAPTTPAIGYRCRKCEFRGEGDSGFKRCWGALAEVKPHMLDVGYVYFAQDAPGRPIVDEMASAGKASALDIPSHAIRGENAPRIALQLEGLRLGREILRPQMAQEFAALDPIVHLLDIEALRSACPAHRGGRVNRLSLFQFSVHTLKPGLPLQHRDWLNTDTDDPNLAFIAALRGAIGDEGSVLIWTDYERQSFREVVSDCMIDGRNTSEVQWLWDLLNSGRLVDQHEWCRRHYWHPLMGGRTSLKYALPAAWSEESPIKRRAPFREFPADRDPYSVLKEHDGVADGCAAMIAYLKLLATPPGSRPVIAADLRRYNTVDTMAQVFLYEYWAWRLGIAPPHAALRAETIRSA